MKFIKIVLAFLFLYTANESFAAEIQIVTSQDLVQKLKSNDETKKVLLFFTSWCPYCKSAIQTVLDSNAQSKVTLISLDKDYAQISNFAQMLPTNMKIYCLKNSHEIISFFNNFGIKYGGSIPYIAIIDEDNKLLKDDVSTRQLNKYLK